MNLKQIITFLLVISAVIYFTINARKQMEKIENKYETVDNDPLKARVYTLDNGLKVYLTSYKDAPRFKLILLLELEVKMIQAMLRV